MDTTDAASRQCVCVCECEWAQMMSCASHSGRLTARTATISIAYCVVLAVFHSFLFIYIGVTGMISGVSPHFHRFTGVGDQQSVFYSQLKVT